MCELLLFESSRWTAEKRGVAHPFASAHLLSLSCPPPARLRSGPATPMIRAHLGGLKLQPQLQQADGRQRSAQARQALALLLRNVREHRLHRRAHGGVKGGVGGHHGVQLGGVKTGRKGGLRADVSSQG